MDKCYVTAVLSPKAGMEDKVKAECLAIMPTVRKEQGSLRYDLHTQQKKSGVQFLFYEIWKDGAALEAHLKTPHMVTFLEKTKDMLAAPLQVDVWSSVNVAG